MSDTRVSEKVDPGQAIGNNRTDWAVICH